MTDVSTHAAKKEKTMTTEYVRAHYCSPRCETRRHVCDLCASQRRQIRDNQARAKVERDIARAMTTPTLYHQPFAELLPKIMGARQ